MSTPDIETLARVFYNDLLNELDEQATQSNSKHDGDRQDGFVLDHVDEGWVTYKGMSLGIVRLAEPPRICFTFGPDGPFVGYKQTLVACPNHSGLEWKLANKNDELIFDNSHDLAAYCLASLAHKVHDLSPIC